MKMRNGMWGSKVRVILLGQPVVRRTWPQKAQEGFSVDLSTHRRSQ